MRVEIAIANANAEGRNYLTWAPVRATLRLVDAPPNGGQPIAVTVRNQNPQAGGQLEFALSRGDRRTAALDLKLPTNSSPVEFFVAGGPGGQHRNKTETGVRLHHGPSGVIITATERRKVRLVPLSFNGRRQCRSRRS